MGFFNKMFDSLAKATDELEKTCNNVQKKKAEYESYNDNRLVNLARNGSFSDQAVAISVLKERYGDEETKNMIRG